MDGHWRDLGGSVLNQCFVSEIVKDRVLPCLPVQRPALFRSSSTLAPPQLSFASRFEIRPRGQNQALWAAAAQMLDARCLHLGLGRRMVLVEL